MEAPITTELRLFLDETGLSAERLARSVGINPNTITRLLTGKRRDIRSATADALRNEMRRIARAGDAEK